VAVYECARDGSKSRTKLNAMYWRWYRGDESLGFVEQLCDTCVRETIAPIVQRMAFAVGHDDWSHCHSCGMEIDEWDRTKLYLSAYLPKSDPERFQFDLCDTCGVTLTGLIRSCGRPLPNRQTQSQSTTDGASLTWSQLGIEPHPRDDAA